MTAPPFVSHHLVLSLRSPKDLELCCVFPYVVSLNVLSIGIRVHLSVHHKSDLDRSGNISNMPEVCLTTFAKQENIIAALPSHSWQLPWSQNFTSLSVLYLRQVFAVYRQGCGAAHQAVLISQTICYAMYINKNVLFFHLFMLITSALICVFTVQLLVLYNQILFSNFAELFF